MSVVVVFLVQNVGTSLAVASSQLWQENGNKNSSAVYCVPKVHACSGIWRVFWGALSAPAYCSVIGSRELYLRAQLKSGKAGLWVGPHSGPRDSRHSAREIVHQLWNCCAACVVLFTGTARLEKSQCQRVGMPGLGSGLSTY